MVLEYQRVEQECISPQKAFAFFVIHAGQGQNLGTGKGWKSGLNMNASSLHKRFCFFIHQGQILGNWLWMEKGLNVNASSLHKRLEAVTY